MNEENKNVYVKNWLLLITLLVALMIIVGGLTRLTESGLSITKWDLFSGILPPLTLNKWEELFSLYKEIPEFKLLNYTMNLNEFKIIFYWEYSHRLLGRIIGLTYIVPLVFFTFKKTIKKKYLFLLYLIFILICIQGFVGWYMVESGLINRTDVSHYRLSLHLTLAFIIFILLLWNYFIYNTKVNSTSQKRLPYYLTIIFLFILLIQISVGAFVSGLNAGQIYQSWPLMNRGYFPDDSNLVDLFSLNVFDNPSLVQFIHRNIAYLIFLQFSFLGYLIFANDDFKYLRNETLLVFFSLLFQIILGILTVLSGAQIILASFHQIGSIILITTTLRLIFKEFQTS